MNTLVLSVTTTADPTPRTHVVEALDENDMIDVVDLTEDEINLAAEAELIGDWIAAKLDGDHGAADLYEAWQSQVPTSHPGRHELILTA